MLRPMSDQLIKMLDVFSDCRKDRISHTSPNLVNSMNQDGEGSLELMYPQYRLVLRLRLLKRLKIVASYILYDFEQQKLVRGIRAVMRYHASSRGGCISKTCNHSRDQCPPTAPCTASPLPWNRTTEKVINNA